MKKKNLILLSMACALCSGHAHARISFRNGISLKHGEITAPFVKEGTANYDAENKVLTLENAVIESWLTITDDDVTINLIGENVIDNSNVTGGIIYYGALYMYDANLTITSVQEGSLKIIDKDKGSSLFDSKLTVKDCSVEFDGAMMGLIGHRYDLAVDNAELTVRTDNGVGIAGIQSLELKDSEVLIPDNYKVNVADGCIYYVSENEEDIYRGDLKVVKADLEQQVRQHTLTGISDVNTSQDKKQPVYNLQGVQVNPSRKGGAPGIRIVGGKKYFVR
ncbi:MAG: hypothetical protein KBT12_00415 [Bacteroidales bacterium]|nr:hypothetical protein [Candidatus Physcousia equi]